MQHALKSKKIYRSWNFQPWNVFFFQKRAKKCKTALMSQVWLRFSQLISCSAQFPKVSELGAAFQKL